jgi:putative effector of murein hydrolase
MGSVYVMCKLFGLNEEMLLSLLPKSVTTAIGADVATELGGIAALTTGVIILTGIVGNLLAVSLCKAFRITDSVAKGIAIGTSSHAMGTAYALQMGETEGAMSGLSIGITGILTAIVAPLAAGLL